MNESLTKVLLVDDDASLLDGVRRALFDTYDVTTALSGQDALQLFESDGPFVAVISDMRMPHMDGAELLARVRVLSPDTVRILLTGETSMSAAIRAVNEGEIFRFLCKPCTDTELTAAIEAAVRQHALVTAERKLLEETLNGTVKVLCEALALSAPFVFERAQHIKRAAMHLSAELRLPEVWKIELAALLSHTGCIALPTDILQNAYGGERLGAAESKLYDSHPETAYRLLAQVPRLTPVAEIIRCQTEPTLKLDFGNEIKLYGAVLRAAIGLDRLMFRGATAEQAIKRMRGQHAPELLDALANFAPPQTHSPVRTLRLIELLPQMVLEQDVRSRDGNILVGKGQEITRAMLERLHNFAQRTGVQEPIRVRTNN
jgi:DNA-binding response OmpR family regulator